MARHDHRNDQATGQVIPLGPLGLDQLHGGMLAAGKFVQFVFRRVDEDHGRALAHGAGDLAFEVVTATELLGIDEQFGFVVEVRLEVATQRLSEVGFEFVHQVELALCITDETGVTVCHRSLLICKLPTTLSRL